VTFGQAHSRPRALESHILYTNRRGFSQGSAFWRSHRYVSSHRGVIPKNPLILGTSMGISSLIVYGRISAQEKRITTLDSSKCASRQDTQQCAVVKTKISGYCKGQTYKSLFQRQIYSQISKHSRKSVIFQFQNSFQFQFIYDLFFSLKFQFHKSIQL
jgi:hypothetical protein